MMFVRTMRPGRGDLLASDFIRDLFREFLQTEFHSLKSVEPPWDCGRDAFDLSSRKAD